MNASTPDRQAISALPQLSGIIPDPAIAGFPEDFSELFAQTKEHLLRNSLRDGTMIAFRYEDLRALAANSALGMPAEFHHVPRFSRNLIFTSNPPIHAPMRKVISRPFSPLGVQRFDQRAKRIAAALIDEAPQHEIDFCSDLSERFTARFWGEIFELTDEETECLSAAVRNCTARTPSVDRRRGRGHQRIHG